MDRPGRIHVRDDETSSLVCPSLPGDGVGDVCRREGPASLAVFVDDRSGVVGESPPRRPVSSVLQDALVGTVGRRVRVPLVSGPCRPRRKDASQGSH